MSAEIWREGTKSDGRPLSLGSTSSTNTERPRSANAVATNDTVMSWQEMPKSVVILESCDTDSLTNVGKWSEQSMKEAPPTLYVSHSDKRSPIIDRGRAIGDVMPKLAAALSVAAAAVWCISFITAVGRTKPTARRDSQWMPRRACVIGSYRGMSR